MDEMHRLLHAVLDRQNEAAQSAGVGLAASAAAASAAAASAAGASAESALATDDPALKPTPTSPWPAPWLAAAAAPEACNDSSRNDDSMDDDHLDSSHKLQKLQKLRAAGFTVLGASTSPPRHRTRDDPYPRTFRTRDRPRAHRLRGERQTASRVVARGICAVGVGEQGVKPKPPLVKAAEAFMEAGEARRSRATSIDRDSSMTADERASRQAEDRATREWSAPQAARELSGQRHPGASMRKRALLQTKGRRASWSFHVRLPSRSPTRGGSHATHESLQA